MDALPTRSGLPTAWFVLAVSGTCAVGCGNVRGKGQPPAGDLVAGDAGSGNVAGRDAAGAPAVSEACVGNEVILPKRLVRLSWTQLATSIGSLTDEVVAAALRATYELVDTQHRTFPPLASPREGSAYTGSLVGTADHLAADVAKYVADNVATLTTCGSEPTAACATEFITSFAERAYRRPLTEDERTSLLVVPASVLALGDTPTEALRYGVYAVLESPQFLYRTEFGVDSRAAGPLTPSELADALAYFITDGPPDAGLVAAARSGELSTRAQVTAQAKRLLASPVAKRNLEAAVSAYFGLYGVETAVIDRPEFTVELRNSMLRESELFLSKTLWSGPLSGLLTSRASVINAPLASLYQLAVFPPAGGTLDAQGFASVDLPEGRAGILTQAGFLAMRSRPDAASVVGRGLWINRDIVCAQNPEFPGPELPAIQSNTLPPHASERQKADYRAATAPCGTCHTQFDAYGLALDNFDAIGAFRSVDDQGRPIDPAVDLPDAVGGGHVESAVQMARVLADSGRFESCMAQRFSLWAFGDLPTKPEALSALGTNGCATQAVVERLRNTPESFEDLLLEIATSSTFSQRLAGQEMP